jgi:hypothetical protein
MPIKMPSCRLVLMSAAILLHATGALAGELVVDAQMQARDLLSGAVSGRAKTLDTSPPIPADGRQASNLDSQEQARQLILGKANFGGVAALTVPADSTAKVTPAVSTRGERRVHSSAQESAQRMILGKRV